MPILLLIFILCLGHSAYADDIPFFYGKNQTLDKSHWYTAHGWANGPHQSCEWRKDAIHRDGETLTLTLSDKGGKHRTIGCAEARTQQKFGFGRYEARMKTAAGKGLNTAFFTYIGKTHGADEHDEIDFEFLGKNPKIVQVRHWRDGKGTKPKYVRLGFDSSKDFHNYAFEWDRHEVRWYVDDRLVHKTGLTTDEKIEAPQNEQHIFLSLWSGSDRLNDWLGDFQYTKPVTAEIEWLKFTPFEGSVSIGDAE